MTRYAALLAVLMVGIAVGQKPAKKDLMPPVCGTEAAIGSILCISGEFPLFPQTVQIKPPKPIDVPAIQETQKQACATFTLDGDRKITKQNINDSCNGKGWTCADKERILEHSESGKYWCRKPQP